MSRTFLFLSLSLHPRSNQFYGHGSGGLPLHAKGTIGPFGHWAIGRAPYLEADAQVDHPSSPGCRTSRSVLSVLLFLFLFLFPISYSSSASWSATKQRRCSAVWWTSRANAKARASAIPQNIAQVHCSSGPRKKYSTAHLFFDSSESYPFPRH